MSKRFLTTDRLGAMTTSLGSLLQCLTTLSEELIPNIQPELPLMSWWYGRERNHRCLRKEGDEEHISMKTAHNCRTLRKNGSYTNYSDGNRMFMPKLPPGALQPWAGRRFGFNGRSICLCPESCVLFNSSAHREWPAAWMKVTCFADTWMTELAVRWRSPCFTLFPC